LEKNGVGMNQLCWVIKELWPKMWEGCTFEIK
jgi:hypothetical protein